MNNTPPTPPPKPSLHLNVDDWLPYLEDEDVPDAQKIELIKTLWSIVLSFVDLGWDFETSQKISGQSLDLTEALRQAMLHSQDTPETESEEV